jgi:hypothetical protein
MRGVYPILASLVCCALTAFTSAQPRNNPPHIGYIYPAGGQRGTTLQVVIGGQFLDGVSGARITAGPGIEAAVLGLEKPLTATQASDLRDKLKALQDKRQSASKSTTAPAFTEADQKTIEEIRKKLAAFQNKPASPSIAEMATLQITISANADIGSRELRLITPAGLSNPMAFCIGGLNEFSEPPAKATSSESPTPITLPAIVNGQILPGGVNRYRFHTHKGDSLVFSVSARELIPYLADAVPGWFQATLGIYDASGRELAYADHWRFAPDPVIHFQPPSDDDYTMEIKDSLYRGREDFVYRITAGELPFVTSAFPLGGRLGAHALVVELSGWNLPVTRMTPGVMSGAGKSPFTTPFAVDALPERNEQEPNDSPESAQAIGLPVIINGRIDHPGDVDVYRFDGQPGEEVVAEVYARRLNSPLDSILKLTDADGKQLAINDDHDDKAFGLLTHQADSYLRASLPARGTYDLHIGDAQHKGGPEYGYRLRISRPRPDFELRVTPSCVNLRAGGSAAVTVNAIRRDGFAGDIMLNLSGAPPGCTLAGKRVAAGQNVLKTTITATTATAVGVVPIRLEGKATIDGQPVVRAAIPAEDMMQAFFYRHLVPAQDPWLLCVVERRGDARPRR